MTEREEYEEVEYQENRGRVPEQDPMVSLDNHQATLLEAADEALGRPEAIKAFINGTQIGFEPCNPAEVNAYKVTRSGFTPKFSVGWAYTKMDLDERPNGRARLRYDEDAELWYINVDEAMGAVNEDNVTVDNVISALRLSGEYLEKREHHDLANQVGRVYRDLKERREDLRRDDRMVSRK